MEARTKGRVALDSSGRSGCHDRDAGRSRHKPNANAVGSRKYEYHNGYSSMLWTATRKTMTKAAR